MKLLFFYSERCRDCKDVISLIQGNNLDSQFNFVSVDDVDVRNIISRSVQQVPALVFLDSSTNIIQNVIQETSSVKTYINSLISTERKDQPGPENDKKTTLLADLFK